MANIVTISGMFGKFDGKNHTYFADSPVVIDISGLQWPPTSPFNVVRVEVVYNNNVVGEFRADTGGQTDMSFDISSALRAIWSDITFSPEVTAAQLAADANDSAGRTAAPGGDIDSDGCRVYREYCLRVFTEYLSSTDGFFTTTQCSAVIDGVEYKDIPGGQCLIGGLTEWERSLVDNKEDADASHWEHTGVRNGDASTKPITSPERVGSDSITSWTDVSEHGTKTIFYPSGVYPNNTHPGPDDDPTKPEEGWQGHAPLVLRDSQPYIDFLFVNRRGAVETCSALMKEQGKISAETTEYSRIERPKFKPSRSLMTLSAGGRRSWSMSSGKQTREWLEWWTMEFLPSRQKWMRYKGPGTDKAKFVPVTVTPSKKSVDIYDRSKQNLESIEFTVTLGLEG